MMEGRISYDLDQLDDLAVQIHNLVGFISEHLAALDAAVASVHADGGWTGAAADAHREAHTEWATGAKEFNSGVESMRDSARKAHTQYSTALTANTSMFRL